MTEFIDVGRKFRDLTDSEPKDSEMLASLIDHGAGDVIDWPGILESDRVVLLAEAGSGKTEEMKEQAKALSAQGKFAAFLPLEALCRGPLEDNMDSAAIAAFSNWKTHGTDRGWFFLDSVDEMKLTNGKLETALRRVARDIDGQLGRASIILSSRPSDWRPEVDRSTFITTLPIPSRHQPPSSGPGEFLRPVPRTDSTRRVANADSHRKPVQATRIVAMLPLTPSQIKEFAKGYHVTSPDELFAEIDRRDAWVFANRPLDLSDLIRSWTKFGRIGTRAEQHEDSAGSRLRDDPDRRDIHTLSDEEARLGIERLALAVSLSRVRMILVPELAMDADRKDGTLDVSLILTDWNEAERHSLLMRAIFDPATYGRVRFHHRSVQEYLAARCLKRLRDSGMATASVSALLFADQYHTEVVIPSMRPVAAWLALWDNDVRNELMKREPETLLSLGDPESLPIPERAKLLRAFADMYGQGGWRGIGISISEVRRFSCTELAPIVRELWGEGPQNEDVRTLLLETIWCGSMAACMDITEGVARNADLPDRDRRIAVQALIACNQMPVVRSLADTLMAQPDFWPDRSVHDLAALIFPKVLTLDELLLLVERTHEPDKTVGGFGWELLQIADSLEPTSSLAMGLRDRLADLIWRGRKPGRDFTNIAGRFDRLAPALARLCHRQIAEQPADPGDDFLRACVIAARFGGQHNHVNEPLRDLITALRSLIAWREPLFWADLAIMDALVANRDDANRLFHTCHYGLLNGLTDDDIPWIETALGNNCQPKRRGVALQAWVGFWQQRQCPLDELPRLHALVADDAELAASAQRLPIPIQPNPEQEKWTRKAECQRLEYAANRAAEEAAWLKWRAELIADPNDNFTSETKESTLRNMYSWLEMKAQGRNRRNVWDRRLIEQEFGKAISERVIQAGRRYWRTTRPLPETKRPVDQWNITPGTWTFGLTCISAEASIPGWAAHLTQEEARTAAAYALIELNGFAPIINDLAVAFPDAVDEVIGGELSAQLNLANDHRFLSVLQKLEPAGRAIQKLLAHRLLAALPSLGANPSLEAAQNVSHHLHSTLRILTLVSGASERRQIAELCAARFEENNSGHLALHWLRGLFALDAYRGTKLVSSVLVTMEDTVAAERATAILVALFGDRESASFNVIDPEERAQALGTLIRIAYSAIRPRDDQRHEGSFTPNYRDNAESARQFLLGLLIQTPGPHAGALLYELAREPEFAHFPDRLRMFARQRAASDSEPPSFTPVQIVHLVRNCEMPPHDRDGLFNVMMSRLNDLAHKIAVSDFTDRRTLRTISSEEEMQRTLSWRLEDMAKGAYIVSREDEVADRKRVDIRLVATCGRPKAVIEIKIADNWSFTDFERTLNAQLVGQYLRHEDCKAGCLLLTYSGTKNHWKSPHTGRNVNFREVLKHLREAAQKLEAENGFGIRLSVFELDLRDPYLEPAHG